MTTGTVMGKHEGKGELTRFEPGFFQNPFAMMRRLSNEMDRMFEGFWHRPLPALWRGGEFGRWVPDVEMSEHDGQLVVRADLPGMSENEVKVEIADNELVIEGERKREHEEKEEGYYTSERVYGAFHRAIPLPEGVNHDEAKATFANGVLEVTMPAPKHPEKHGRRLEIKTS